MQEPLKACSSEPATSLSGVLWGHIHKSGCEAQTFPHSWLEIVTNRAAAQEEACAWVCSPGGVLEVFLRWLRGRGCAGHVSVPLLTLGCTEAPIWELEPTGDARGWSCASMAGGEEGEPPSRENNTNLAPRAASTEPCTSCIGLTQC